MAKLSTKDKMQIAFSTKSTRDLGTEYNVHHSTPANIKKEARTVVGKHWDIQGNNVGRPSEETAESANLKRIEILENELEGIRIEKQLREDYLQLKIKLGKEDWCESLKKRGKS